MNNKINLEYLYLDVSVCSRCQGSDLNLEKAVEALKTKYQDVELNLEKIHINSIDLALLEKFVSSPTIRIDGKDLPVEFRESNCESCGDYCGSSVDCRVWVYNGKEYDSAPTEMIVDLVSDYVDGKLEMKQSQSEYQIPENIIHFFSERIKKVNELKEVAAESCCVPSSCGC